MVMQQPGDLLLSGQLNGAQLGNALFQFLPSLPGEGPPLMPRALAKALFPQGFAPGRFPAVAPPVQPAALIPPAGMAQPPAPTVDNRGNNNIQRRQPMTQPAANASPQPAPPAPAGYRPTASGGNPIGVSSQRLRIAERSRGM
ncbi:hypothetical protein ES703_23148 [subsurface metagenome]